MLTVAVRDTAAPAPDRPARVRPERVADAVVLGVLAVVLLLQDPGRTRFDTKLDLVVDPWGFLARAFSAWDPSAGFGQLQNQAYGYLFPMGPFFGVAHTLGIPVWVTQALWAWLLLGTAYLGLRVLAARLGLPWYAAVIGGLAYAFAPRLVTVVGPLSAEALPAALLPWTLVPLVSASGRSARRTAFLAALPVLLMGAANATLTLAVLPATVVWLLCRREGRWRLLGWWSLFVALFCAWWAVPLLVQAKYATPFLNFIESGRDTAGGLTPDRVVRGDVHWVAGIVDHGLPWWPAGHQYAATTWIVVGTLLVAATGLAGMAARRMPERVPSALTALLGLVAMAAGSLLAPWAPAAWALLDGPLSPFRNVHKFDPLLRLPLSLGAAVAVVSLGSWATALMARRRPDGMTPRRWTTALPAVAAGVLVVATAAPLVSPGIAAGRTWTEMPSWWTQAAGWLGSQPGDPRALVVPGSGFGQYVWGRTIDEPLQPLATTPWAIDNGLPLGSVGSARVLDSVSAALRQGRAVPGLAATLARSGIAYVVARNDLDVDRTSSPAPSVVAATLSSSPGFSRVASFGEIEVAASTITVTDFDRQAARPAIEVYRVTLPVVGVSATALSSVGLVTGGPEALLPTAASGLLTPDRPVVMADDGPVPGLGGLQVETDTLMRRDRALGRGDQSLSSVLTADEPSRLRRRSPDLVPYADPHFTVASYRGVAAVSASTSRSYADTFGELRTEHQPFAALDGEASTWWQSGGYRGPVGEWLQVDLRGPTDLRGLVVSLVRSDLVGSPVTRVQVSTGTASWEEDVSADGTVGPVDRSELDGATSLRITAVAAGGALGDLGIREIRLPGVTSSMPLLMATPPASDARRTALVLAARQPATPACTETGGDLRCDPNAAREDGDAGVLDRLVPVRDTTAGPLRITGRLRQGPATAQLFDPLGEGITVRASSWLSDDVHVRPSAAVDGDPGTRWVAGLYDPQPSLSLSWGTTRTITSVRLVAADDGQRFAAPLAVRIEVGGRSIDADLGSGGTVALPPTPARSLRIVITRSSPVASVDGSSGLVTAVPVAVSEVEVGGASDLVYRPDLSSPTGAVCGLGPTLQLDGAQVPTRVSTTLGDVLAGAEVAVVPCGRTSAVLGAGVHRIVVRRTGLVDPTRVVIGPTGSGTQVVERDVRVASWSGSVRAVDVGPGPAAVLRVPESSNPGWTATLDGVALAPLRVDGWQQGWIVPEGAGGTVQLRYGPTTLQQAGLAGGALLALLALVLGLLPRRAATAAPRWSSEPVTGLPHRVPEVVGLAVGGVLLGVPGIVAGLVAGLLGRGRVAVVLAGASTAAAGLAFALGAGSSVCSALALTGALVATVAALRRRGR